MQLFNLRVSIGSRLCLAFRWLKPYGFAIHGCIDGYAILVVIVLYYAYHIIQVFSQNDLVRSANYEQ